MTESALSSIAADAAQRIGAIVDAAHREADELLVSARRQADEIVTAARLEAAERQRRDAARVQAELQRLRELTHTIGLVAAQIGEQSRTVQQLASDDLVGAPVAAPVPPAPASPETVAATPPSVPVAPAPAATPEPPADLAPTTPPADVRPAVQETDDQPAERPPTDQPADSSDRLDAARLVALSMAATGSSRQRVEQHLRDELQIQDTSTVIDYVFGISTPASVVPSWPPNRSTNGTRS
jgi:hypothetical protein